MPLYRINKSGYFMGKYYAEGTELDLHPKQAKYGLLSGQLVAVGHAAAMPRKAAPLKAAPVSKVGERSSGKSVGGTMGGVAKR